MGDFARGEFLAAGQRPGRDFLCFRLPGSQGAVSFGLDNFAMFSMPGADQSGAQQALARLLLDRRFQSDFNVVKGSVPARTDVPDDAFDDCGKKGMKELAQASRHDQLVGTVVFGHAVPGPLRDQIVDIVDRHFNRKLDDDEATAAMARVLRRRGSAQP
jgi:glucose/mannose transport system substrate-binding protein